MSNDSNVVGNLAIDFNYKGCSAARGIPLSHKDGDITDYINDVVNLFNFTVRDMIAVDLYGKLFHELPEGGMKLKVMRQVEELRQAYGRHFES